MSLSALVSLTFTLFSTDINNKSDLIRIIRDLFIIQVNNDGSNVVVSEYWWVFSPDLLFGEAVYLMMLPCSESSIQTCVGAGSSTEITGIKEDADTWLLTGFSHSLCTLKMFLPLRTYLTFKTHRLVSKEPVTVL